MKESLIILKIASNTSDFLSGQEPDPGLSPQNPSYYKMNDLGQLREALSPNPAEYLLPPLGESPKQHINELNKYIKRAKSNGSTVELPLEVLFFHTRPENRYMLEKLVNSKINFYFINETQEKVNREEAAAVLRFFSLDQKKENHRKRTPSDTIWGNPLLNSQQNTELSSRRKTQKAFFDIDNIYARKEIVLLKSQGYSANKIAEILNDKSFQTSRGNSFQAKQITRHLNAYQDVVNHFKPHSDEENYLKIERNTDLKELPVNRVELPVDRDFIIISFKEPIDTPLQVWTTDNQGYKTFYKTYENLGTDTIIIDILRETTIYPGANYLFIQGGEYTNFAQKIIVRPDLIVAE